MIKLNENYSFKRDTSGWQLYQWRDGKDRNGNVKRKKKITYHATIAQVISAIIDKECGKCKNASELKELLKNAEENIMRGLLNHEERCCDGECELCA